MANQYGFSLAEAISDAESIKRARMSNESESMDLSDKRSEAASRPARQKAEADRQNTLSSLRVKAASGDEKAQRNLLALDPDGAQGIIKTVSSMEDRAAKKTEAESNKVKQNTLSEIRKSASSGDESAQRRLLALDPEGAPEFLKAVSTMDESAKEKVKENIESIGRMSSYVLQGKTEQEQASRYQAVYDSMPEETKSRMPSSYDPNFVKLSLSRVMTMDQILENPKAIKVGDEDVLYKGGREIERAKTAKSSSSSSQDGIKSADESLMYRQAAERLGGVFDESGNLRALDPTVRDTVQSVTTEATKIFRQGGVTRSEAVSLAYDKIAGQGSQSQSLPAQVDDPLGIL